MGNKIKITVIASGFKLYGEKTKPSPAVVEWSIESAEQDSRRSRFYGTNDTRKRSKRKPNVFIFSPEDLLDDKIVHKVEDTPTQKRGVEQLKQIKNMSAAAE